MSAVSQVHTLLADLGGYFEDDSTQVGSLIGRAEAPPGKVWYATGCHMIAVNYHTGRQHGWAWLLGEIRQGVVDCQDPACEICEVEVGLPR